MTDMDETKPGAVLLFSGAVPGLVATVSSRFRVLGPVQKLPDDLTEDERLAVRVYVSPGSASVGIVDALPNLGLIACLGAGYDGIDVPAMRARGIAVTHSPGANASSVAEMALALLLASCRRVASGDRFVRAGEWAASWPKARMPYAGGVAGRRVGILGLGAIGAKIAQRLTGFEVEIGYYNRSPRPGVPYAAFDTPLALAEWADLLVIAVPGSPATRHMVDEAVIDALGADGHIVNIARGSVVDEAALIAALTEGRLAGAGLDVFAGEPNVDPRLTLLPNVVLTPHEGGFTTLATGNARVMLMANLAAFFDGKTLPNPVPG
jgi:lactate dehydrogenase-like 2-hydroxyacid dehydrogenase